MDLTGWFLSHNTNLPSLHLMPDGHMISPFGHVLVWADGEPQQNSTNRPDIHVSFSLARSGEAILLSAPDGSLVDSVGFGPQFSNESQGRFPDGGATIVNQLRPTPNGGNLGGDVPPRLGRVTVRGDRITLVIHFDDSHVLLWPGISERAGRDELDNPGQLLRKWHPD